MKSVFYTVLLVAILLVSVYFLGKRHGSKVVTSSIVQNIEMVREIAELSSLEVSGTQKITFSNVENTSSYFNKLKNYFFENTLQVVVPYKAKFGADLNDSSYSVKIITEDSILLTIPDCKLLSLELELDKLTTMNQAGLFTSASMEDLKNAQKELYQKALGYLTTDGSLKQKARENIMGVLRKYYRPMGINAGFVFK